MFQKILLSSDFLMTSDSEQRSNLKWLYDLIKRPIEKSTGKTIETFASSKDAGAFDRAEFFHRSGIVLDEEATQFFFQRKELSEDSVEYLLPFIKDSLIIGYEFSDQMRTLLDEHNITYIDLWLHPIRYMDDVLFGFSSNNKNIFAEMKKFNVDEYYFHLYADRFKISTYKGYKRYNIGLEDNSVLFIGQTLQDKAILKDGEMLNILSFKERIEQLSKEYNKIYYSRHPYTKNDQEIMSYIQNTSFIELTEHPSYVLLAQPEIKKVVSVSSSVAIEAKYFDKDVEILHKPIIELSTDFGLNNYITILQDFAYPHFWSRILSGVMDTIPQEELTFFSKKDKIRDMLGFYWSYKVIDKVEAMRNQLNAVDSVTKDLRKKPSPTSTIRCKKPKKVYEDQVWRKVKRKISEHEVVSFDIFDTLLVRPLEQANDLFDYMEEQVRELTNGKITNFKEIRLKARQLVKNGNCGEEICLKERYDAIAEYLDIPTTITDQVMELELTLEKTILYKRDFVNDILEEARRQGKKIVVISDIFYSDSWVRELLAYHNIRYDNLYVSSHTKLLKHTGNIYPFVLEDLGIKAENVLHIGDNKRSDVSEAAKHNISTLFIPRTVDFFNKKSGMDKSYDFCDGLSKSIIKGLVGNKVMNNPLAFSSPSHTNGSVYNMGYSMVGTMFFGFAKWILEEAKREGLKDLYFLARDGKIIKEVYDIISAHDKEAPKSHYLYVSRRALSVPNITTEEDIEELARINYSNVPLKDFVKNRFGLDYTNLSLTGTSFTDWDEVINSKDDTSRTLKLLIKNKKEILRVAAYEKEMMMEYLHSEGLSNNIHTAIVDIGHNGTLQKRLIKLLNNNRIGGYYFVTHLDITPNILDIGAKAEGYVGHKINGRDKRYPYNQFILMFEATFLNEDGSFVSFKREEGKLERVHLPTDDEAKRIQFTRSLHKGIIDFANDVYAIERKLDVSIRINGRKSLNPYLSMLKHPHSIDVMMFNEISFENIYSGRDRQYLIKYDRFDKKDTGRLSLWKEGTQALCYSENEDTLQLAISKLFDLLYKKGFMGEKKYDKFLQNPRKFFNDSKYFKILKKIYE